MLNMLLVEEIVRRALVEDLEAGDVSSSIFQPAEMGRGEVLAKEEGVIAGLPVAGLVFNLLSPDCRWQTEVEDGQKVSAGQRVATVSGPLVAILAGERVALNFLQRLSGIATLTARYCEAVKPYPARITDTRKTVPGLRMLDKYAVRVGGGQNHRLSLSDAVLIKDNHIRAAGGIAAAVEKVRRSAPFTARIEVEVESLEQVKEALDCGADIVMLDNMDVEVMRKAVQMVAGRAIVEASGGITLENVHEIAATGVDFISVGALTHSVRALDLSLEILV
ncbi:MAG: hypothetical protein PWP65_19 [Clostridia bacterium]|nr:hypothetical protein [Clostridia bacterium]